MQNRETVPSARRAVVVSPSPRMVKELEPLLAAHLSGAPVNYLDHYPSPRDLSGAIGGRPQLVFLDVASDPDQAVQLLSEVTNLGGSTHILALLPGNDPDFILRCLR